MYKIGKPADALLAAHFRKYAPSLQAAIRAYLPSGARKGKGFRVILKKGNKKKGTKAITTKIRVLPGTLSEYLLKECSKPIPPDPRGTMLWKLLCADNAEQEQIILDIAKEGRSHGSWIGKIDLKNWQKHYGSKTVVDDFIFLMRKLFEEEMYETTLNKEGMVAEKNLRICPYCGRAYVYSAVFRRNKNNITVKPDLDHFLPKSLYPYFAINYYNLIPCCKPCNMNPCKSSYNPLYLTIRSKHYKIMSPYQFDTGRIKFRYKLRGVAPYKMSNFSVHVDYGKDKYLAEGYNQHLAILALYKQHNLEVHELFNKMQLFKSYYTKMALASFPIPADYFKHLSQLCFGYNVEEPLEPITGIDPNGATHLLHKFNRDIFEEMKKDPKV